MHAAGEERQRRDFRDSLQARARKYPFLAAHISVASVLAPVDFNELPLHLFVAQIFAELIHPGVGELPIVVEPRPVLPAVKLRTSHALRRKQADCLKCGALKRAARIHQDAIHVEDNYGELAGHRAETESADQREPAMEILLVPQKILRKTRAHRLPR